MNRSIKNLVSSNGLTTDASRDKEVEALIKMCDAVSCLCNQSVYLVDYIRQDFLYVSPHPLFLCGYELEEVKSMGYSFLEKIFPPDDLQLFLDTYKLSWQLIYEATAEDKEHFRLSYDVHFKHKNGDLILVNKKVAPLLFTADGEPWIGMCIINTSSRKESGHYVGIQKNKNQYFRYEFDKKRFVSYEPEKLSKREEEIIRLSMQGYVETDIAKKLHISIQTVRNHRYNAEKKLGVNNLTNAVAMFNSIL